MKDTRTEFKFFSIYQWKKEQDYLRKQHKNGWKFIKVNLLGCYHFEKCEPEDVIYQLDYNLEGLAHKDEYVQMFHDCGWEYIQDFCGYSYFRKPSSEMNGEEEIFCDDSSRLDMMKRVFWGRITPLFIPFFLLILPNIYMQSQIDCVINHILTGIFIGLFALYVVIFSIYGYQFWKLWRSSRG